MSKLNNIHKLPQDYSKSIDKQVALSCILNHAIIAEFTVEHLQRQLEKYGVIYGDLQMILMIQ